MAARVFNALYLAQSNAGDLFQPLNLKESVQQGQALQNSTLESGAVFFFELPVVSPEENRLIGLGSYLLDLFCE